MENNKFKINSGILASREKLKDRFLFAGKITKEGSDNFVFYIIEILSPWFPSTKVETAITGVLQRSFLNKNNYTAEDFENVLQAVNGELGALSQQGENDWIGNLNALLGFTEGNKIHLTMCGTIPAFLVSGNRVSNITDGLCSKGDIHPLKTFANITSGSLTENDRVILGNIRFYDHISIERLRRLFDDKDSRVAAQEIYRFLKKSKIKDVSSILLRLTKISENDVNDSCPDIFYLDQNEESAFSKFYKKISPFVTTLSQTAIKGSRTALAKAKEGTSNSGKKLSSLHKKYSPGTKNLFEKSTRAVRGKTHDLIGKVKESKPLQVPGVKIKSYVNKKSTKTNPVWEKLVGAFQIISDRSNRRYIYVAAVILLIFIGYLKVKSNNENKVAVSQQYDIVASVDEAEKLFREAKEEIGLGKSDGKEKLIKALEIAKNGEQSDASREKSLLLQQEIQKKIDEIIKATSYYNLAPIFTLNGDPKAILVGTTLYSINQDGKIYSTDTKDKEPVLVSSIGTEVGKVVSLAFSDSQEIIYILTDTSKILSFDVKNQVSGEAKIDDGTAFVPAKAISAYSSNLYLLETETGKILKYTKSDTGFSKGTSYSSTGSTASLKECIDLAIDGNVFALKADAAVLKFSKGNLSNEFSTSGLPAPTNTISKAKQIASDADSNHIFLLDQGLSRVVKYDKNSGSYVGQYSFPGINIDQFFINPRIQKMWILSGNKVYEINL